MSEHQVGVQYASTDSTKWWAHVTHQDLNRIEAALSLATTASLALTNEGYSLAASSTRGTGTSASFGLDPAQTIDVDIVHIFRALSAIEQEESNPPIRHSSFQIDKMDTTEPSLSTFVDQRSSSFAISRRQLKAQKNLARTVLLLMGHRLPDLAWPARIQFLRDKIDSNSFEQSTSSAIQGITLINNSEPIRDHTQSVFEHDLLHSTHGVQVADVLNDSARSAIVDHHRLLTRTNPQQHCHGLHNQNSYIHQNSSQIPLHPYQYTGSYLHDNSIRYPVSSMPLDTQLTHSVSLPSASSKIPHPGHTLHGFGQTRQHVGAVHSCHLHLKDNFGATNYADANGSSSGLLQHSLGQSHIDVSSIPHVEFDLEDITNDIDHYNAVAPTQHARAHTHQHHAQLQDHPLPMPIHGDKSKIPIPSPGAIKKASAHTTLDLKLHKPSYIPKLIYSQSPARRAFDSWKIYVSETKRNRNWIVQKWVLATQFWQSRALRFYTLRWHRLAVLNANSLQFSCSLVMHNTFTQWQARTRTKKAARQEAWLRRVLYALRNNAVRARSNIDLFRNRHLVQPVFIYWRISARTINHRRNRLAKSLDQIVYTKANGLKLTCFQFWKLSTKRNIGLRVQLIEANQQHRLHVIRCVWKAWSGSIHVAKLMHRHHLQRHFLTQHRYLLRWKQRFQEVNQMGLVYNDFIHDKHVNLVMRLFLMWYKWSYHHRGARLLIDAVDRACKTRLLKIAWGGLRTFVTRSAAETHFHKIHKSRLLSQCLLLWLKQMRTIRLVRRMFMVQSLKPIFQEWLRYTTAQKVNRTLFQSYKEKHNRAIISYYFHSWSDHTAKTMPLRLSVTTHSGILQARILLYYFYAWRTRMAKKTNLYQADLQFGIKKRHMSTRLAFSNWKFATAHHQHLRQLEKHFTIKRAQENLKNAVSIWKAAVLERHMRGMTIRVLTRKMWLRYRARYLQVTQALPRALACYQSQSKTRACTLLFHHWKYSIQCQEKLSQKAYRMHRYILLRTTIQTWMAALVKYRSSESKVGKQYDARLGSILFQRWKFRYTKAVSDRKQIRVRNWQMDQQTRLIKTAYVEWRHAFLKRHMLARRVSVVERISNRKTKMHALTIWKKKHTHLCKQSRLATAQYSYRYIHKQHQLVHQARQERENRHMHAIMTSWQLIAAKNHLLRVRLAIQLNRVYQRRKRIVLMAWNMSFIYRKLHRAEKSVALQRRHRVLAIVMNHWRLVKMTCVAHRIFFERLCRSIMLVWRRRYLLRDGDRRALSLYQSRICGLAMRKWVLKVRIGLGPAILENTSGGFIVSLNVQHPSLPQPRYIKTSISKNHDAHFALDAFLRVLYSCKVLVPMVDISKSRGASLTSIVRHISDSSVRVSANSVLRRDLISSPFPTSQTPLTRRYLLADEDPNKLQDISAANPTSSLIVSISRSNVVLSRVFNLWHSMVESYRSSGEFVSRRYQVKLVSRMLHAWIEKYEVTRQSSRRSLSLALDLDKKHATSFFCLWMARTQQIQSDLHQSTLYDRYKLQAVALRTWVYSASRWRSIDEASHRLHTSRVQKTAFLAWRLRLCKARHMASQEIVLDMATKWRQKRLLGSTLIVFQARMDRLGTMQTMALAFLRRKLTRRYILKWMLGVIYHIGQRRLLLRADYHYNQTSLLFCFTKWHRHTQRILQQRQNINHMVLGRMIGYMHIWQKKATARQLVRKKLVCLKKSVKSYRSHRVLVAFQRWHVRAKSARSERLLENRELYWLRTNASTSKAAAVFGSVHHQPRCTNDRVDGKSGLHIAVLNAIIHQKAGMILAFDHWRKLTMQIYSDKHFQKRITTMHHQSQLADHYYFMLLKKHIIGKWDAKTQKKQLLQMASYVTKQTFSTWRSRAKQLRSSRMLLLQRIFRKWKGRLGDIHDMYNHAIKRSTIHILKFSVYKWVAHFQRAGHVSRKGLVLQSDGSVLIRSWKLRMELKTFIKWRELLQRRRFEMARKMIYADTWSEKQLKRKILLAWRCLCETANAGVRLSTELSFIRHHNGLGGIVIGRLNPQIEMLLENSSLTWPPMQTLEQPSHSDMLLTGLDRSMGTPRL
ncbi:hypothetical protein BASA50_002148 [Batrachochytrium salamandrivorans]|uniref:Sfi1 spindle body domain-containing protein n=1 Tax=Batrachochytrium salamandrivorans TaxID=1357716 RepID=A0ABQ8FM03_9FUNG|nr:hypothetical protein BASA50_002148 [Batrachochytrium salamandrivorans]